MAFLCPVRVKKEKKKDVRKVPRVGRITGSSSLDTLVQVDSAKQNGTHVRMLVIQDFEPCVNDEIQVRRGQEVNVLYQENDWLFVVTPENKEGFVPYNYCVPLERSVDDFAEILKKKQELKSPKSDSGESTFSLSTRLGHHQTPRKSVPDIAQDCTIGDNQSIRSKTSRGSQKRGILVKKNSVVNSEAPKFQKWDALPWENERYGRRSMRSVRSQTQNEIRTNVLIRSRSLDREQGSETCIKNKKRPEYHCARTRGTVNVERHGENSYRKSEMDYSDHIYANDGVVGVSRSRDNRKPNKPDVLPASSESVQTSSSRVSLASQMSGSSWRNLSTRSAPTLNNNASGHQSMVLSSQQYGEKSGYTTAQVTCDFNRSRSDPHSNNDDSVFMKSDLGRCRVLYDFEMVDEDDLSVMTDDLVTVLNTEDTDWFWVKSCTDEEGFVPASYLEIVQSEKLDEHTQNFHRAPHTKKTSTPVSTSHARSASFPVNRQYCSYDKQNSSRNQPRTASVRISARDQAEMRQNSEILGSASNSCDTNTLDYSARTMDNHLPDSNMGHPDLSKCIKLVCLYSYVAQSAKDISVTRGDWLFADFDNQKNDNWLWVYSLKTHSCGYVPRSYVKTPNFGYQGPSVPLVTPARDNGGDVTNVRAFTGSVLDPFLSP